MRHFSSLPAPTNKAVIAKPMRVVVFFWLVIVAVMIGLSLLKPVGWIIVVCLFVVGWLILQKRVVCTITEDGLAIAVKGALIPPRPACVPFEEIRRLIVEPSPLFPAPGEARRDLAEGNHVYTCRGPRRLVITTDSATYRADIPAGEEYNSWLYAVSESVPQLDLDFQFSPYRTTNPHA